MKTFNYALVASALVCLMSVFSSCKSTAIYYQISQTKPVDETIMKSDNNDRGYYYEDENCRISYNFWSENGDASFQVTNLTDEVLYIVKDKCFFIKNGVSNDYFQNREWVDPVKPGLTTTHTKEKNLIGIAPHASKNIGEYVIYTKVWVDCDLNRQPKKNEPQTIAFTLANTPVQFGNFITYKVGDNGAEKAVSNLFYTSRVTNYRKDDIFTTERHDNCPNVSDIKTVEEQVLRFAPATGYYVTYVK